MEIVINGSCLEGKRTGVGRYMANILNVWIDKYPQNRYNIFFRHEIPGDSCLKFRNVRSQKIYCPEFINKGFIWENLFFSRAASKVNGADILFSPSYTLPITGFRGKKVVTIFDISYISHPEWFPVRERIMYRVLTGPTVKKADLIFTGSEFSKREILKFFNVREDKIYVTYPSVDPVFLSNDLSRDNMAISEKYRLSGKVILYVGLIANRRNVTVLIEAFSKLLKSMRQEMTLVVIGKNFSFPFINIEEVTRRFKVLERVRWIPYLDDLELLEIYRRADLFVYPSLYEGFGIPPLEAMAMGVPVITSNMSSLPEVVGDSARLLEDPRDPVEMFKAMEDVLSDENKAASMIAKGKERSALFSWEKCANQTMELLQKIA